MQLNLVTTWDSNSKLLKSIATITGGVESLPTLEVTNVHEMSADSLFAEIGLNSLRSCVSLATTGALSGVSRYNSAAEFLDEARVLLDVVPECPVAPTPDQWLVLDANNNVIAVRATEQEADAFIATSVLTLTKMPYWVPPPVAPESELDTFGWIVYNDLNVPVIWFTTEQEAENYAAGYFGYVVSIEAQLIPEGLPQGGVQ